ncbi:PREDICTED: probable ATP-dependent RNA helicase DDX20 [Nicrophorus vespilloides]|uniref:RNA helicase n=1 Tax=Nicrophorus vespilloides TaxID=110193 RepID=A0ABM1M2X0_NICVS|nr:PREDICTED: probable ATP-dependent RNA helicase DDX20 [Nicrophorus vespilloides]
MSSQCAHNLCEKERSKDILINEQLSFTSLLLSDKTLTGLTKSGFEKPSPIQVKAIPVGRCGFDLIVKSKSGTGKTAVFGIIALEMLNLSNNDIQVLILAPTREIAAQICDVIKSIGADYEGLKTEYFIGGLPIEDDIEKLKGCHIAVGAPGRIRHLMESEHLKINTVKLLVMDEADKLMESSFQHDINKIYHKLPPQKQIIASSATYPDKLNKFLAKYMQSPSHISPNIDSPLLLGLKHFVSEVKTHLNIIRQYNIKNEELIRLLSKISYTQCLVFTNFQSRAESISNTLNRSGWGSTYISAAQSQNERLEAIQSLKDMKCRILLSTDLTARGIDASNVDLVINYDVPIDASTYLHRMGRAGRYGSRGICISIAGKGKELMQFQNIIGMIGGNTMGVGKLPNDDTFPDDLWEVKPESFEQIYGIVDESCVDERSLRMKNIKGAILDMKNIDANSDQPECKGDDENTDVNMKQDDLNVGENDEATNILLKLANGESSSSIKEMIMKTTNNTSQALLANGEKMDLIKISEDMGLGPTKIPENKDYMEGFDTNDILMKLANGEAISDDVNESFKRKRDDQRYQKNVSLMNIAKCLYTSDLYGDNQVGVSTVQSYLNDMKTGKTEGNKSADFEDVFKFAYDYNTKPNEKHWLDAIGEEFDENEVVDKPEVINLLDCNDDDEEYDDYDYDEEEEAEYEDEYEEEDEFEESLNKKPKNEICIAGDAPSLDYAVGVRSDNEYAQNEKFVAHFNNCSDQLLSNFGKFDSAENFHTAFAQWQQQINGVRDYVQQNIYLQEMNNYQYYKYNM